MCAYERAELLGRIIRIMQERKEDLAHVIVREAGKPLKAARAEIERTISTYQFSAEEVKQLYGVDGCSSGGVGRIGLTWREPLVVVTAITPFNFPFNLIAHKLGPAFAAGNAVVLKPAEQTPLNALYIANIFKEAGLPDGALQVVTGSGRDLSDALTRDEHVKKVTFTGSAAVGQQIKAKVGLRKITLELGSNAALIVEPDTPLEPIIPRCVEGAFSFSGQVCISLQRIYVHESIYNMFSQQFIARTSDETTDVSSMIREEEAERTESWIDEAVQAGAMIGCGGTREGAIFSPTVLLNVTNDMAVSYQPLR